MHLATAPHVTDGGVAAEAGGLHAWTNGAFVPVAWVRLLVSQVEEPVGSPQGALSNHLNRPKRCEAILLPEAWTL